VIEVLKPGCLFILAVNKEWHLKNFQSEFGRQVQECNSTLLEETEIEHSDHAKGLLIIVRKNK